MNSELMSSLKNTLNIELINAALAKTPTGGNAQQFIWKWVSQNTLHVHHESALDAHYLNRNLHTSWIALGCLIESVSIAAAWQGFTIQTTVQKDLRTVITFTPASTPVPSAQFMSLIKRSTFRGRFEKSEAPNLHELQRQNSDVQVHVSDNLSLSDKMIQFIKSADMYLWLQSKATVSFFREIRFFDPDTTKRGIRSANLGVGVADQIMLYLFSFVPKLLSLIVRIPLLNFSFKQASIRNLKNAHFVLITSSEDDVRHLIEVGRKSMQVWLQLEDQGYSVQPYSTASITLLDARAGHMPPDILEQFRTLFSVTGPEVLAEQFHLKANEKPVWLFRVGKK